MTPQPPRKLGRRYTPLRYPGGKAKLAPFVKQILAANNLEDGHYVEPFAGGAGIAIEILLQGYVSRITLNDISLPIFAFWSAALRQTQRFIERVACVPLTLQEWDAQKATFTAADASDLFGLGFAAFYLNRTNRSGVLNGGLIGGRSQQGNWLIDARFNRPELIGRIERIAKFAGQIELSCRDAVAFLQWGHQRWSPDTFIYADPPYYVKGRQLYYDYYTAKDHAELGGVFSQTLRKRLWMVSYDDVPEVRSIYGGQADQSYYIPYSVRRVGLGSEVMFYSNGLRLPIDMDSGEDVTPAARFDPQEAR